MTNGEERVERRKHKRFRVEEGAFVVLKPYGSRVGRLIDISMDGLTFDYINSEEPSNIPTELDIIMTDSAFRLHKIPCKTIWNSTTYESPLTSIALKRCGVQFGDLTQNQISQLEHFIHNHTVGEA